MIINLHCLFCCGFAVYVRLAAEYFLGSQYWGVQKISGVYASSYTAEPGATPPGNGVREYNPRKIFEI